ncbi:MAG: hypothetical protein V4819_22500 [Verrucomicrobiota bacterium]
MKTLFRSIIVASLSCGSGIAVETFSYSNYIRQYQMPSDVTWDASSAVAANGTRLSDLAINPGGARFDLWTMKSSSETGLTEYLLSSSYVGTYVPIATVVVRSEDGSSATPRVRADKPFYVDVTISGLRTGATDPEPSKSVKFFRHVQSYGAGGTGVGIDRDQATLLTQSSITTNGVQNLTFLVNSIPGANRFKVRGEERFSVFSLADYQAPESQLASQYIQVWPTADAAIAGIAQNQLIRFSLPAVTLTLKDLYPGSRSYAQVYKGEQRLGMTGKIVPGSGYTNTRDYPEDKVLSLTNYDSVFDSDGRWTMELITVTPFGTERMRTPSGDIAYVTFDLDRTIQMNGSFTTIE